MGEAKLRSVTELFFGKLPKGHGDRGIIVSTPIKISDAGIRAEGGLDPAELRFALLYWDRLVHPSSTHFLFEGGPEEQLLVSEGVLSCPVFSHSGGDVEAIILDPFFKAFEERERRHPGAWAVLQGERSLNLKGYSRLFQPAQGLSINLFRAIPVPTPEVPINEILEFKRRRKAELIALREHMDNLSTALETSEEHSRLATTISEIDKSCADLLKVSSEWQSPVYISDLNASINYKSEKALPLAGGAFKLFEPYGLTAASVAAGAAGLMSVLEIKSGLGFRSPKRPPNPFRFSYLAHKELRR